MNLYLKGHHFNILRAGEIHTGSEKQKRNIWREKKKDVRLECLQWTPEQKARGGWKRISTLYGQNRGKKEIRKKLQKKN